MEHPSLTVAIPNYNHSRYLPEAIEAVLAQSRPPDEFILLDDASTDNSVEIAESYARNCAFMRVARNERNLGVVATLQRLLEMSRCDWVYFGAADDHVLPGFFEQAMAMAHQHPGAGILFGQVAVISDAEEASATPQIMSVRRWTRPLFAPPEVFLREYLQTEPTWRALSCATVYRREALMELGGFRPEVGHLTDTFAIRGIGLKHGACYVPEPWAAMRYILGGYSASQGRDAEAMLGIVANLVALMRSPEFRDRFPEAYVLRWRRELNRIILEHYIWRLREPFGLSLWGLWRGRLLKRYLLARAALVYRGDVEAFIAATPVRPADGRGRASPEGR